MNRTISILTGVAIGAVAWPTLRSTGSLARWLCEPFGRPGRVAMVISLLLAAGINILGIVTTFFAEFFFLVERSGSLKLAQAEEGFLRRLMLASSLLGLFLPGIAIKTERLLTSSARNRGRKRE